MAVRQDGALALCVVLLSVSCNQAPLPAPPPVADDPTPLPENTGHVTIHVKGMTKQLALT
jgi:hypothetical protein